MKHIIAFSLVLATLPLSLLASAIEVSGEMKDVVAPEWSKYQEFISQNDTQECIKQMASTDGCVARMLFLSEEKVAVPKNLQEINSYCGELKKTIECVNEYKKCLKLFSKTFFGIIVRDVKKTMKNICSSQEQKEIVLKHLTCFDDSKLPLLYSTIGSWTKLLSFVSLKVDADNLIPYVCCAVHVIEKDGLNIVNKECNNSTGLLTGEFVVNLLKSCVHDATDLGCGKHKNFDVCQKYMANELNQFTDLITLGRNESFRYTPIVPLLNIAKRLDERNVQ